MALKKLLLSSTFVVLGLLFSFGTGQGQIWLYSVNDNDPNQLTRVDITDPTPALTVVANKIRYGADFGRKDAGGIRLDVKHQAQAHAGNFQRALPGPGKGLRRLCR